MDDPNRLRRSGGDHPVACRCCQKLRHAALALKGKTGLPRRRQARASLRSRILRLPRRPRASAFLRPRAMPAPPPRSESPGDDPRRRFLCRRREKARNPSRQPRLLPKAPGGRADRRRFAGHRPPSDPSARRTPGPASRPDPSRSDRRFRPRRGRQPVEAVPSLPSPSAGRCPLPPASCGLPAIRSRR
jgi:hypothetical protein